MHFFGFLRPSGRSTKTTPCSDRGACSQLGSSALCGRLASGCSILLIRESYTCLRQEEKFLSLLVQARKGTSASGSFFTRSSSLAVDVETIHAPCRNLLCITARGTENQTRWNLHSRGH